MSRTFTLGAVLRMVPGTLLPEAFRHLGHPDLVDWAALGRDRQPLLAAIGGLRKSQYDCVEAAFRAVFDLACRTGAGVLREVDAALGAEADGGLPADAAPYHRAAWTWLRRPAVFTQARTLHRLDTLSWWRRRDDLPRCPPDLGAEALARLQADLSAALMEHRGCGRQCTVETFDRQGVTYVVARPDDVADTILVHDDDGALVPVTQAPTFDVVYAFDRTTGALELFAQVPPRVKGNLEQVFARVCFGRELGPWRPTATYRLDHLLDEGFRFDTDPADRMRVHLRKVRLRFPDSTRTVQFTADPDADLEHELADFVREALNPNVIALPAMKVTLATLNFDLDELVGVRRGGSFTFDVAPPDGCGLRNQSDDRIALGEKYLRRWGILVPADGGTTAQAA
jgi:hypothetical protein